MSKNDPVAERELAKWRRQGKGVWRLTFVVEGYDDEVIHLLPGKLSQRFASRVAAQSIAFDLKVKRCYIILQSIVKEN